MQKEKIPLIICGDWNLVMDYKVDTRKSLRENNVKARREVLNMIEVLDLVGTWRSVNDYSKNLHW